MFCRKCGTELSDNINFCFNCGTPVEEKSQEKPDTQENKKEEVDELDKLLSLDTYEFDDENIIWEEVPIDEELDFGNKETNKPKKDPSKLKSIKSTIAKPIKPKDKTQTGEKVVVVDDPIAKPEDKTTPQEAEIPIVSDPITKKVKSIKKEESQSTEKPQKETSEDIPLDSDEVVIVDNLDTKTVDKAIPQEPETPIISDPTDEKLEAIKCEDVDSEVINLSDDDILLDDDMLLDDDVILDEEVPTPAVNKVAAPDTSLENEEHDVVVEDTKPSDKTIPEEPETPIISDSTDKKLADLKHESVPESDKPKDEVVVESSSVNIKGTTNKPVDKNIPKTTEDTVLQSDPIDEKVEKIEHEDAEEKPVEHEDLEKLLQDENEEVKITPDELIKVDDTESKVVKPLQTSVKKSEDKESDKDKEIKSKFNKHLDDEEIDDPDDLNMALDENVDSLSSKLVTVLIIILILVIAAVVALSLINYIGM